MPGYSKNDQKTLIAFGSVVRTKREALGMSQEELAEEAHLHRTYMGGIEQGRRNLSLLNILKVAKALGVEPGELFADMPKGGKKKST